MALKSRNLRWKHKNPQPEGRGNLKFTTKILKVNNNSLKHDTEGQITLFFRSLLLLKMEEIIMEKKSGNEQMLLFSYLELRTAIGILGIALPFVVSIGAWIFFQTGLKGSLSAYYHSGMRDVFVGIMFAYGFFLLSYKGWERKDNIAGTLACVFALGVALFPTPHGGSVTTCERIMGIIHFISAAAFFLTLIYFCLCLFTKTNPEKDPTKKKKQRNRIYRFCGYGMLTCIVLIGIISILPGSVTSLLKGCKPVFWLESLAIFFFGFSWFTKGEAILKDEVEPPAQS